MNIAQRDDAFLDGVFLLPIQCIRSCKTLHLFPVTLKRNRFGTAADHDANVKIFPTYRVLCEIKDERWINSRTGELEFDKSRPTEITVVLKEV